MYFLCTSSDSLELVYLKKNCHIPDIFYNTVLVDRVCRHVAVKVQTVGPFDLHHSVLKKKFEEIGNWFLTSFKWLGFALPSASFLTCGILMKGISEMSVSRRYPKMHLRMAWCATMRRGAVDPDRHSSSNRSRKGTKRSQQST